jgi:hypothetical protein
MVDLWPIFAANPHGCDEAGRTADGLFPQINEYLDYFFRGRATFRGDRHLNR